MRHCDYDNGEVYVCFTTASECDKKCTVHCKENASAQCIMSALSWQAHALTRVFWLPSQPEL